MFEHDENLICNIEFATPAYDAAVRLRYQVLREPLGLDFTAEQLATEYADTHLGLFLANGQLAGYLCLTAITETEWKMRQVAVIPEMQKTGIGSALVLAAEAYAKQHGVQNIVLHARKEACAFYLKHQYSVEGEPFEEIGIVHYAMSKAI